MILIIGGSHQGKLNYALEKSGRCMEQVVEGALCEGEEIFQAKVLNHLHSYIKNRRLEQWNPVVDIQRLLERNPDIILICDELGCGVVPIDPFDREYRETVGRICCSLAEKAEQVYRVTCGLGIALTATYGSRKE